MEKDCNTCTHHQQESIAKCPSLCWDCTATTSLIHWEPISIRKLLSDDFNKTAQIAIERDMIAYASLHGTDELLEDTTGSALDTQVAGSHYKNLKIQPMEYSMGNKLDACQHTAIKYITRFRDKGGKEDLLKARHAIDMLIEFEYGN